MAAAEMADVARVWRAALQGGDKSQREAAYAQLDALAHAGGERTGEQVETAVASIKPLFEQVLTADLSVIDVAEFQRASNVVMNLYSVEPFQVCVECVREHTFNTPFTAPGNAVAAVFEKTLDELTRDDAMTVGVSLSIIMQVHSIGMDRVMGAVGWQGAELLAGVVEWPMMIRYTGQCGASQRPDFPEYLDRLALLSLETLRAPPEGASAFALCGVWWLISTVITGRADAAMKLIGGGLLELAVATLQESSAIDWIAYRTPAEVLAMGH
jgi:hypothetical protein